MEISENILKKMSRGPFQKRTEELLTSDHFISLQETSIPRVGICSICGGLGYIVPDVPPTHPGFGRAVMCQCRKAEFESLKSERLMNLSGLEGLQSCTFSGFITKGIGLTPLKQKSLEHAVQAAVEFAETPKGWLLFQGGYGCGKTHLAAAIANYRIGLGYPTLFVSVPDILDHLRATYSPNSEIGYDERFEQIRNTRLLVLDDLGTQSNTDWSKEKLYQIFNYRYSNHLPTVITTNQEIEAIEPRIRSRLVDKNMVTHIKIMAPDFRRPLEDRDSSDLSSLSLHHHQTFDTFDIHIGNKAQRDNLRKALNKAQEFADNPIGWLVFYSRGIYSNGKTHLSAAIANYVAASGESVLFVFVPDLLDHLRSAFNPASGIPYDKRFDEVRKSPLLVLDDLGIESATNWAKEKIYQLFNYRYNAQLPTIITTSLDIEKDLDPKLATRLLDGTICKPFWVQAESYKYKGE